MNLDQNQKIVLGVIIGVAIVLGILISVGSRPSVHPATTINMWVVGEDSNVLSAGISGFMTANPGITVKVEEFDEADYEEKLVEALASNEAPDVFMIKSSWAPKYLNKIVAVPETQFAYIKFRQIFPQVVIDDFSTSQSQVFGLPLSTDVLSLYYNTDIFNAKGIVYPPTTWTDFQNLNTKKGISAGIGGSSSSIGRASDIFTLVLLQEKNIMPQDGQTASLGGDEATKTANFYFSFKAPKVDSFADFINGKTGMIFDYHSSENTIKEYAPYLNYAVAPAPQFSSTLPVALAKYYGFVVSKNSVSQPEAWDLIIYLTTNEEAVDGYITETRKIPVLKSVIAKHIDDADIGVFAKQVLIARTWVKVDDVKLKTILDKMIDSILEKKLDIEQALLKAGSEIRSLENN